MGITFTWPLLPPELLRHSLLLSFILDRSANHRASIYGLESLAVRVHIGFFPTLLCLLCFVGWGAGWEGVRKGVAGGEDFTTKGGSRIVQPFGNNHNPFLLHEDIGVVSEVYQISEKWSHEAIALTLVRVVKFSSVTIQEGFFVHTSIPILFLIFSSIVGQHRKLLSWPGFHMSLQQRVCCLSASAHVFVAPKGVISPCSENPTWCIPISAVPTVFPSSLWRECESRAFSSAGCFTCYEASPFRNVDMHIFKKFQIPWPAGCTLVGPEVVFGAKMHPSSSSSYLTSRCYACCPNWCSLLALHRHW